MEDGRGALTRAPVWSRASKIHTTLHTRAVPNAGAARARVSLMAGATRRTVLVASAWTILDAEDNPLLCGRWSLPFTAVSSCELERDLACRTQFRDSVASVSK